jgi:hypothetical protein
LQQKYLWIQFLPLFISSQPLVSHSILGLHYNKWCRWRYWLLFRSHEENQCKMVDPIQRNSSLFSSCAYLATISSNSIAASIPMHQLHLKKDDNLQFSPLKVEFKKALHVQAQSQNTRKNSKKPCMKYQVMMRMNSLMKIQITVLIFWARTHTYIRIF